MCTPLSKHTSINRATCATEYTNSSSFRVRTLAQALKYLTPLLEYLDSKYICMHLGSLLILVHQLKYAMHGVQAITDSKQTS